MTQANTKEFTTSDGTKYVLKEWLTRSEEIEMGKEQLKSSTIGFDPKTGQPKFEIGAESLLAQELAAVKFYLVSINGNTDNVVANYGNLKGKIASEIYAEITKLMADDDGQSKKK